MVKASYCSYLHFSMKSIIYLLAKIQVDSPYTSEDMFWTKVKNNNNSAINKKNRDSQSYSSWHCASSQLDLPIKIVYVDLYLKQINAPRKMCDRQMNKWMDNYIFVQGVFEMCDKGNEQLI